MQDYSNPQDLLRNPNPFSYLVNLCLGIYITGRDTVHLHVKSLRQPGFKFFPNPSVKKQDLQVELLLSEAGDCTVHAELFSQEKPGR